MREILFKGKRFDTNEWIQGQLAYFFDQKESPYIMPHCYYATREMGEDEDDEPIISDEIAFGGFIRVHPDTVCQFTGLLDKNGNKIFDGDIITFNRGVGNWTGQRLETTHEVYFENGICAFCMKANGSYIKLRYLENRYIYKITGNIHDETH